MATNMKKILVVDDDQDTLTLAKYLLSSYGYEVITHSTGNDVTKVVSDYKPDLILLDVILPGSSGLEICKEIKSSFNIPIILLSSHADKKASLDHCDASAFINKPYKIEELIDAVKYFVPTGM